MSKFIVTYDERSLFKGARTWAVNASQSINEDSPSHNSYVFKLASFSGLLFGTGAVYRKTFGECENA